MLQRWRIAAGAVAELRPDAVDARRPADRGQHALGWTDLRRGRPVGGDRGRAGSHARPREPSIVDQLADADPRWAGRGALAAGVVTGPRPAAIAPKGVFGDGDLQDASARVWGRARPRRTTRGRPAVQSLPHRAARRIGRRSTRFRGPHRRPWPSPPGRSRRSGAPGGRETRRPRHGPVAGHASGTSPLMPAFHAVGCATPGGALTRWCVARGGGAARGAGGPGARAHGASPVRAAPDRRPADPRPRAVPVR